MAGDDIPLLERMQGGVVVGDYLAIDLEQEAVGAFDDLRVRLIGGGQSCGSGHASSEDSRTGRMELRPYHHLAMPQRATKRGEERTPLRRDCDVLICGASFAGLAVARELAGSGADVMVIDRYEIGERQTSACGIPTSWLHALALQESLQQTFGELVIHTPHATVRYDLPWTFSTFDYRTLCGLLAAQGSFAFETAKVDGREGSDAVVTDRGTIRAGIIVDGLGWRRVLGSGANVQPPDALLSCGLEVHPFGGGSDLEVWIDRGYVPAGYGWSFPAGEEVRIGVGSFDPRFHVKEP